MTKSISIIQWIPRILCILAILFISMFALDAFNPDYTPWQQVQALFIHLIPTWVLIVLLVVAWKWELAGGIVLMALALGFTPFVYLHNYAMNHSVWISLSVILVINFPFLVTGALFVLSHFLRMKARNSGSINQ
jgi:hypothetical protein